MTPQQQMKAKLESVGLPFKKIDVYGAQIVVTTRGESSAKKWAALVSKFAVFRGVVESRDYNAVNEGTCLAPSTHKVWRVFARVENA